MSAPDKLVVDSPSASPPIVIGGREQLAHLLAEASEIEHTLMCTYLYAAFSLRSGDDPTLSDAERQAVAGWRRSILAVAIDEMVHLLLVANLSIAIGGRPHFGRPNFPVAPGYFPSDVVVKLKPFTPATLAHFIYLERPKGYVLEDGDGFEAPRAYVRAERYHGLMPSIQDYATVGDLYEAIRANLIACARSLSAQRLFVGLVAAQVGPEIVTLDGVATVSDLDAALRAVDTIIEQGEGAPEDRGSSHFRRFCEIRDEYRRLCAANARFEPAWPAAESPVMRAPPEPEGKVFVSAAAAARVLDLGNAVYTTMLQLILQSFGRHDEPVHAGQQRHLGSAIGLMKVVAQIGSRLVRLPASEAHPGVHAGLSFTMLRAIEPYFTGSAETLLVAERLDELSQHAQRLSREDPELAPIAKALHDVRAQYARG